MKELSPEEQFKACAWGMDAIENKETFEDAFILSMAMFAENPGFNSDSHFQIGVTIAIDPEKPGGRNPSEDDQRGVFAHDMEIIFQKMICKTLDAAHSGNASYLRDLAKFLEENARKEGDNDPLRIFLLQYKKHLSVLNEILAIWNRGLAETIETRPEISKEMLPDIEKELFSTIDIESLPNSLKEQLVHMVKNSLTGLLEKSKDPIEWTVEPLTINGLCHQIPISISKRDPYDVNFQRAVRKMCSELGIPIQKDIEGRPPNKK